MVVTFEGRFVRDIGVEARNGPETALMVVGGDPLLSVSEYFISEELSRSRPGLNMSIIIP